MNGPLHGATHPPMATSSATPAADNGGERVHRAILATIRHELRTPINGILGYSEMLLEDLEDSSLRPDLLRIHEAGSELLARVNEVLDPVHLDAIADLESFGASLRRDLRTPINTVLGYTEILLEDAVAGHRDDIVPDLERVRTAASRFLALIDDVVSFSAATRATEVVPEDLLLDIHGTGTSALMQNVVTTMQSLHSTDRTAHAERGALLIVDDNDLNRDVLTRHLERQGHIVTAVADGLTALEALVMQRFDLVLLDVMMPGINGYEVLQRLKADSRTDDLPVIMISALDELDAVVGCVEMGAADYLSKPFNPILLRARISACLEKKRLRDQEKEYLRQVQRLTAAATAVEASSFDPGSLAETAERDDALGHLARVFQGMAEQVYAREQHLKEQVRQLRIEVDQTKVAQQVAEITDTDYFQDLARKAQQLRNSKNSADAAS